jgi:cardiolipin synthase (CMP-forming)
VSRSPGIIINVPNLLTLLRILITPLFVIVMIKGQYRLALLIFFLAGISDGLDGLFARWFNQKTVLGAHLDPIADKLLLTSAFVALAVQQIIPGWLAVVVISRDILIITGIAMLRFFQVTFTIRPSKISKCTTAMQLATVFLVLLRFEVTAVQPLLLPLFWFTTLLTTSSGLHYVVLGIRILNQAPPEKPGR